MAPARRSQSLIRASASAIAILVAMSGCSMPGAAWISSSKFNYRDYAHRSVAVLPVVLAPELNASRFPESILQAAIADQLDILDINHPVVLDAATVKDRSFPYTPERLAKLGEQLAQSDPQLRFDAVVGATIVRMDVNRQSREWSITGNIAFVDVKRPERRWTVSKTWKLAGQPGDRRAALQLATALTGDFFDVRRGLRRGRASILLRHETVVADAGPILNLHVVDAESNASNNTAQTSFYPTANPADSGTALAEVWVEFFAIDDAGLTSLLIDNPNSRFHLQLYGTPGEKSNTVAAVQANADPIYLADRLAVPLRPGMNEISLTGTNQLGQKLVRTLNVRSEALVSAPTKMIVIAPNTLKDLRGSEVSPQAANRLTQLVARQGALGNGNQAIVLVNDAASYDSVFDTVTNVWNSPSPRSRRVISFIGRAEIFVGRPYLLLYDSQVRYPEIGSLSADEFRKILDMDVVASTVEVCTSDSTPEEVHELLAKSLGDQPKISVSGDCNQPLGDLFLHLEQDELQEH